MTELSIPYKSHHIIPFPYADIIGGELVRGVRYGVQEHHTGACEFESKTYRSPLFARAEVDRCNLVKEVLPPVAARMVELTAQEQGMVARYEREPLPLDWEEVSK